MVIFVVDVEHKSDGDVWKDSVGGLLVIFFLEIGFVGGGSLIEFSSWTAILAVNAYSTNRVKAKNLYRGYSAADFYAISRNFFFFDLIK